MQQKYTVVFGARLGMAAAEVSAVLNAVDGDGRAAIARFNNYAAAGGGEALELPGDVVVAPVEAAPGVPTPPAGRSGARPPAVIYRVRFVVEYADARVPGETQTLYCGADRVAARAAYLGSRPDDVDVPGLVTYRTVVEEFDADAPLADATAAAPAGPPLSPRELGTVLAALRYYQAGGQCDPDRRKDDINQIATDGMTLYALDETEVDGLCEKLNG